MYLVLYLPTSAADAHHTTLHQPSQRRRKRTHVPQIPLNPTRIQHPRATSVRARCVVRARGSPPNSRITGRSCKVTGRHRPEHFLIGELDHPASTPFSEAPHPSEEVAFPYSTPVGPVDQSLSACVHVYLAHYAPRTTNTWYVSRCSSHIAKVRCNVARADVDGVRRITVVIVLLELRRDG
jgi:hypothetical protein